MHTFSGHRLISQCVALVLPSAVTCPHETFLMSIHCVFYCLHHPMMQWKWCTEAILMRHPGVRYVTGHCECHRLLVSPHLLPISSQLAFKLTQNSDHLYNHKTLGTRCVQNMG
jgi:hypothetical protein